MQPLLFTRYLNRKKLKGYGTDLSLIYTPKHGSWLNMAEIELQVLNGQCLNRHISTMNKIKEEVEAWQSYRNNKNSKINWQFTNKEARVKRKRLYPSLHD